MAVFHYLVLTRAAEGRAEEFHDWYDAQHVPDSVRVPGVKSARRYRVLYSVGPSAEGSQVEKAPFDSVAIYEIEADDPVAVARELSGRAGSEVMPLTDALDRWASVKYMTQYVGEYPPPAEPEG
jgi:hypothetical protein